METTEIIRILRQCGDCCRSSCEECPDYQKAEEGFRKAPDAKGFMWSCGGVLLDAADRLEEYAELLNEWEPVVHGKVEELKVHAHWVDRYGYKYANRLYVCSRCGKKALYEIERDLLGHEHVVQSFTDRCPECGAYMDERYPNV